MKILLISDNASIINIVTICCERINAELFMNEDNECDMSIVDTACVEDVAKFDEDKTLFLLSKDSEILPKHRIFKPFLPTDLIEFFTNLNKQEDENMAYLRDRIDENKKNISKIMQEIDDMDGRNRYSEDELVDSKVLDSVLESFYNSDDDIPLDEIAQEIMSLNERGFFSEDENDEIVSETLEKEPEIDEFEEEFEKIYNDIDILEDVKKDEFMIDDLKLEDNLEEIKLEEPKEEIENEEEKISLEDQKESDIKDEKENAEEEIKIPLEEIKTEESKENKKEEVSENLEDLMPINIADELKADEAESKQTEEKSEKAKEKNEKDEFLNELAPVGVVEAPKTAEDKKCDDKEKIEEDNMNKDEKELAKKLEISLQEIIRDSVEAGLKKFFDENRDNEALKNLKININL